MRSIVARSSRIGVVAVLALTLTVAGGPALGASKKFEELLKRIPNTSNVIVLVDVDGLMNSPLGKSEKWADRMADRPTGVLGVSNQVSKYVVAASIDLSSLVERWKLGMVETRGALPQLSVLAGREGGYVEQLETQNVAWTPRDLYLFTFPPQIVGFVVPSDRQILASWIKNVLIHPRTFPPSFADRAFNHADKGSQVVMAVNMKQVVAPKQAELWMKQIESIAKNRIDPSLGGQKLADVESAFLQVDVGQTITGTLQVEFAFPIDYLKPVIKELVLTALEEYGAQLDELHSWNFQVDGKVLTMTGRLSEDAVRRLLSVASAPRLNLGPETESETAAVAAAEAAAAAAAAEPGKAAPAEPAKVASPGMAPPSQDVILKTSRAYYRSVTDILASLKGTNRPTSASQKLWYDRYAKQIEELPILNVDEELLAWGVKIARTLREMAYGIDYAARDKSYKLASSPQGGVYVGYNGYAVATGGGYSGMGKGYDAAVMKKQYNAVVGAELDARWEVIETVTSDMRRAMTLKYKVEF